MPGIADTLAGLLRERFEGLITDCRIDRGQVILDLPAVNLLDVARSLCNDADLAFVQLIDLCAVDYLDYGRADWETSETATSTGFSRGVDGGVLAGPVGERPRFDVVYQLLSLAHNRRVRLHVSAEGEPPRVATVTEIWPCADWFEREAFDLFGVLFEGHPDLRRILSDYGFVGHPFRKDYPLTGEVEMRYDPEKRRVVYEPVSIEPRTLVPRVIRADTRREGAAPGGEETGDA
jgi:NADH-quinone oxidoreductase subunit C